jgi:hypothetical protein
MEIQMVKYADDIAVRAQGEIHLKRASECLDGVLKSNYKMKINRETEVTVWSRMVKILILKWMKTP